MCFYAVFLYIELFTMRNHVKKGSSVVFYQMLIGIDEYGRGKLSLVTGYNKQLKPSNCIHS